MTLNYPELMTLIWALWGTSFALTVLRVYLRWNSQRRLYADDHFIFVGICSLTGLTAVIACLLPHFVLVGDYMKAVSANPETQLPLPPQEFDRRMRTSLKLMFAQMFLFWTTLWAAKFSAMFLFRRLIQGIPQYLKAWWVSFTVVLLLYLGCMASNLLTCRPLNKYWSSTGCDDAENLIRADASIKFSTMADVVADVTIMLLPLYVLRKLQISLLQKFGLILIFSLGIVIVAFAFIRLGQVIKATDNADAAAIAEGPILLSMWSHVESSISIIVATLPAYTHCLSSRMSRTRPKLLALPVYRSPPKPSAGAVRSIRRGVYGSDEWYHGSTTSFTISNRATAGSYGWNSETELVPIAGVKKHIEVAANHTIKT
ncbi:hypothetical protein ACN47E_007610 [Coniothyrium glycines]